MRRSLSTAAIAGTAALALTACAPETDAGWRPTEWPVTGEILADAPTIPDVTGVALVDHRLRNDEVGIDARWSLLPGSAAVNTVIESLVRDAVATQAAASGMVYRPQAHAVGAGLGDRGCAPGATGGPAAELLADAERTRTVVTCEVVRANDAVWGVRIRVVAGDAVTVVSDETTTLYADVGTGAVSSARDLFTDTALVWDRVVDTMRRSAGSLSLRPVAMPDEAAVAAIEPMLTDAWIAGGAAVFTLPVGFTAPELGGLADYTPPSAATPVYVSIPVDELHNALSELGRAVAASAGPFDRPAPTGAGNEPVPCDLVPCVAMTLDDGPSALTPGMLDVLRDQDSAATFYMLGQNARAHPDTVRRVDAEGHQIGNHTWNHPYLTRLPDDQVVAQLSDTAAILRSLSGQAVTTFRPPGGVIDDRVVRLAGQPAIMWSVDTRDWDGSSDSTVLRVAVDSPRPGAIVLMHDIQAVTSRIFPRVVSELRDRGFSLVTIDQLFGGSVPAGIVRNRP